jgi:hypothetical protein
MWFVPQRLAQCVTLVVVFGLGKPQQLLFELMPPRGIVVGEEAGAVLD